MFIRRPVYLLIIGSLCALPLAPAQAESELSHLSRSEMLTLSETRSEEAWAAFALIYERLDPSLRDLVPGQTWTDEDRAAAACIYDKVVASDQREAYERYLLELPEISQIIVDNPDITLMTLERYPEVTQMPDIDGIMAFNRDCGQMALMQRRMQDSGLWMKMQEVMMQNME